MTTPFTLLRVKEFFASLPNSPSRQLLSRDQSSGGEPERSPTIRSPSGFGTVVVLVAADETVVGSDVSEDPVGFVFVTVVDTFEKYILL